MMEALVAKRDGSAELRMTEVEADAIRNVGEQMLAYLEEPPRADVRRLFPPAYPDDVALQDQFASYTHDELLERKKQAARALISSIDAGQRKRGVWMGTLDIPTVHVWVACANDARLVLGTRLDVTEEMDHTPLPPDHPDAPGFNLYLYLGGLQELLVEHLLEHDLEERHGTD